MGGFNPGFPRLHVAALVLSTALAACGGTASRPTARPIDGTMSLTGRQSVNDNHKTRCKGIGGYDDIREGAPVVVKDQAGTVIATGALGAGAYDINGDPPCVFAFSVPAVPDATFYTIEVSHRGGLTYSYAEMAARNWTVAFTLG